MVPTVTVPTTLGNGMVINSLIDEFSIVGTTTWPGSWPTSVSFSPAVKREILPAPHVTQLQCPAVIR